MVLSLTNQMHLKPWGVLCFATGFSDHKEENKSQRRYLEPTIYNEMFRSFTAFNRSGLPSDVLNIFISCVQRLQSDVLGLRAIVTGSLG